MLTALFFLLLGVLLVRVAFKGTSEELTPGSSDPALRSGRTEVASLVERVARTLNFEIDGDMIRGGLEGTHVSARVRESHDGRYRIEITVESFRTLPHPIRLSARRDDQSAVLTGDPKFDHAFVGDGNTAILLATLDATSRDTAVGLGGSFDVSANAVSWRGTRAPTFLERMIRHVTTFTVRLANEATSLPVALAKQVRIDPVEGVRERALVTLIRDHRDAEATEVALLAALQDAAAPVRLRAAVALGERGFDVLVALVVAAAIDDTTRISAARRLPAGDGPATQGLLALLSHASTDVRRSAARSLGIVGGLSAIAPLNEVADSLLGDATLRGLARSAVERIQRRFAGAEPGQLSLNNSDIDGAVSLSHDEGAVSLLD